MMKKAPWIVGSLLVVLGIAGSAVAASQNWYMDANGALVDVLSPGAPPPPGEATIPDGATQIWYDPTAAAIPVAFGSNAWSTSLALSAYCTGTFTLEVGAYDVANDVFVAGSDLVAVTCTGSGNVLYAQSLPVSAPFTVPTGQNIALRLSNTADARCLPTTTPTCRAYNNHRQLVITTGVPDTVLSSPSSDPGYPTPELPTVILATAGIGIVGIFAVRGKKS